MPPNINTATINGAGLYPYRGGFFQRISEVLGINKATIPNRTRDMIKELTPNFVKNWRSKFVNFFTGSKTEK